jgi:UDP-N-acetylmuramoyl-L-alanyl-D-glutamate--2,6-diaminopimelate ligase
VKLHDLLAVLPELEVTGSTGMKINGIVYDPLRVKPGFIYTAINIYTQLDKIELPDGHPFIDKAVQAGAVAVMVQQDVPVPSGVTKIRVPDSRLALALVAREFYEHPSRSFKIIGITGTNGKTTTAHIVERILMQRYRTGLIGTLYYKINGKIYQSKDTTPEPPDLQEIFTSMKNEQIDYCVMEVSSHGVDFHRVAGIQFEQGIWTNFSQDHLDWHKTMEAYRLAKLRWFSSIETDKTVIINVDDPSANYFSTAARAKQLTYGIDHPADISAINLDLGSAGTDFTLVTPRGQVSVHAKLRGKFNVHNMLAGAASVYVEGLSLEEIKTGLEKEIIVAGRFQSVNQGQKFQVIIDYAHTPDGLIKVLSAARSMNPRRIITVFGCGGDRDPDKRPKMGAVVEELSDYAIITDDNPRTEDPVMITAAIEPAFKNQPERYEVIHDRYQAIQHAIDLARPGDLVMIAGKGHETTQTLKDRTIHFNDFEVADKILAKQYN